MRLIQIHLDGVEHGPFVEEQIALYLQEGHLALSDQAREAHSSDWTSLRDLLSDSRLESIRVLATLAPPEMAPGAPKRRAPILKKYVGRVGGRASSCAATEKLPKI